MKTKRKSVTVEQKDSRTGDKFTERARVLGANKKTGLKWVKFGGVDPNQTRLVEVRDLSA